MPRASHIRAIAITGAGCALWLFGWCAAAPAWQLRPLTSTEAPTLQSAPLESPALLAPAQQPAVSLPPGADAPENTPAPVPAPRALASPAFQNVENTNDPEDEAPATLRIQPSSRPLTLAGARDGFEPTPTTFRGVTIGQTKHHELTQAWGPPSSQSDKNGMLELRYTMAPFRVLQVYIEDGHVVSMAGQLNKPAAMEELAKQFDISRFTPAAIHDQRGRKLGQIYPERGVLFGFTGSADALRVDHVLFESPSAEGFLTRAEQNWRRNPQSGLADVKTVLQFEPSHPRAQILLVELLLEVGQIEEARAAVEAALEQAPQEPRLRTLLARGLLAQKSLEQAKVEADRVLADPNAPGELHAAAELIQGDILKHAPNHDVRAAARHHQKAAQLATAAVQQAQQNAVTANAPYDAATQRDRLWVAVESYLAIADDVAQGQWRRREEAFAQWIHHAERTVENLAPSEVKDDWLFHLRRRALEASIAAGGAIDPSPYATAALECSARLLSTIGDPQRKAQMQSQLAASLHDAALAMQASGKRAAAKDFLQDAQRLLEASLAQQPAEDLRRANLLGNVYYALGSECAFAEKNHSSAVAWYSKAAPLLETPHRAGIVSSGAFGQQLVTMAISYWQTNAKDRALRMTEQGLEFMMHAVEHGELDRQTLSTPLANLANMNRAMGNREQAQQYQTRLVDFQSAAPSELDK
jgi:hypothetical protein